MKVYLSGGMYGDWQDYFPDIEGVEYFDPRKDMDKNASMMEFVKQDVDAVRDSDVVFLYMEKDNPSGYGAMWECAVATENRIPIIAVWEKPYIDPFISCNALFLYSDLESGKNKLEKYLNRLLSNQKVGI